MDKTFLDATNITFIAEVYQKYLEKKDSVAKEWQDFFQDLGDQRDVIEKEIQGALWGRLSKKVCGVEDSAISLKKDEKREIASSMDLDLKKERLLNFFRSSGHMRADLDPLKMSASLSSGEDCSYKLLQISKEDLVKEVSWENQKLSLGALQDHLKSLYSKKIGFEFMHIRSDKIRQWFMDKIEKEYSSFHVSQEKKQSTFEILAKAQGFELFLHKKFTGAKRFGIEGCETTLVALEEIIHHGAHHGIEKIGIGMAHRGRLNILTNIMGKSYRSMFSEFKGRFPYAPGTASSADVKYHLGGSCERHGSEGKVIQLFLQPNPSHLEFVNPVLLGRIRAIQTEEYQGETHQSMGILLHGDASFIGQGIVCETLGLSKLQGYQTGGTLHIITNNQVGFTTNPRDSRSSLYSSDLAKVIDAPVIHVNGDSPEDVIFASKIAIEFRQTFKEDIFLDIVGYRRRGHNESEEPTFTQPRMYDIIQSHPTVYSLYADFLGKDSAFYDAFQETLEEELNASETYVVNESDWLKGKWQGVHLFEYSLDFVAPKTGVDLLKIQDILGVLTHEPENFNINSKLQRLFKSKVNMLETQKDIDWGSAELLAFGTLCMEGHRVRLSGQDSERGTFSHRHSVYIDQTDEKKYIPLHHLKNAEGLYEVINSPLSEAAVLGYEYGYSNQSPQTLVLWEGQFGDFVNGAQVLIDQFIVSAEQKWLRLSGLVLLLPHGYEGQGPEHSSARPERFLQLCAQDNIFVCNFTTPANYFHGLRRQIYGKSRKPLIVFTPKSLLRHKECVSDFQDFALNSHFQTVIAEDVRVKSKIKRIVVCSGKIYYDLLEHQRKQKIEAVTLVRLEQLYPFPQGELKKIFDPYSKDVEFVFCQEEPKNMGYWNFVDRCLETVLRQTNNHSNKRFVYAGRESAASPAVGLGSLHAQEQEDVCFRALQEVYKNLEKLMCVY